jgi:hypothetical protein
MISKNNLLILIFSFIVSFFVSYEHKKYKLETFFGNTKKNYFQIENIFEFKKDDMIFDYAGTENFKLIIYTNNIDRAKNDVQEFIQKLNMKMEEDCRFLQNSNLFDEFENRCKSNRVFTSIINIHESKKFNYLKFILVFLNIYLILGLLIKIISNVKLNN